MLAGLSRIANGAKRIATVFGQDHPKIIVVIVAQVHVVIPDVSGYFFTVTNKLGDIGYAAIIFFIDRSAGRSGILKTKRIATAAAVSVHIQVNRIGREAIDRYINRIRIGKNISDFRSVFAFHAQVKFLPGETRVSDSAKSIAAVLGQNGSKIIVFIVAGIGIVIADMTFNTLAGINKLRSVGNAAVIFGVVSHGCSRH